MLSVLIPAYNNDVFGLVKALYKQLSLESIKFEVIVIDDASKSKLNKQNKQINKLKNCSFFSLRKNIGRSALRNLLFKKSRYNWLLFLDCDVLPVNKQFIKTYTKAIHCNLAKVVVGGIAYKNDANKKLLRWKFGRKSEEIPVKIREKHPYKYLLTGNFLIKKQVMEEVKFDESLKKYGYEDLLFAKELQKKGIKVMHIKNAVFHLGIESDKKFIKKTKQALKNLAVLLADDKIKFSDTRISWIYKKLKNFGFIKIISLFTKYFKQQAIKNTSVVMYNLFRLGYLHQVFKEMD